MNLVTLAERLWAAQEHREPCGPLTDDAPELTLAQAYQIQQANLERRGQPLIGHKIGLTSKAMQDWLGIDQPDFGGLLADMAVPDGGTVSTGRLLQPRAEAEVAFVLGEDLPQASTSADVLRATAFVLPAIEIVDSRIRDWKIKVADTVADNASSGMFVLGSTPVPLAGIDLRLAGMVLRHNGEVAVTGAGAACMGHPVTAVAWLANTLAALGQPLRKGQVVLSGAMGPVVPVKAGDWLEVEIAHVGTVSCRFGA